MTKMALVNVRCVPESTSSKRDWGEVIPSSGKNGAMALFVAVS